MPSCHLTKKLSRKSIFRHFRCCRQSRKGILYTYLLDSFDREFWLANWAANRSAKPTAFESGIPLSSAFSNKIPKVKNEIEGAVANLLGMFFGINRRHWNYWRVEIMPNFCRLGINEEIRQKIFTTEMGFEPTRAEPIGLAVQRLNHSATQSLCVKEQKFQKALVLRNVM